MNKLVALVPMKGHSERVPNKNIRDFRGEPLFYRILDTLQASSHIEKIIINTDSKLIADLALRRSPRVQINDRPEAIRGDFVSTNDLIRHDLSTNTSNFFIQTHSTNPLLTTKTIDRAIKSFFDGLKNGVDSVFSVNRIFNRFYDNQGNPINHDINKLSRTQDLSPLLEENSNFYIFSRESFMLSGNRIGKRPFLFPMDKLEAIDIDNEEDFVLAEQIFDYRNRK